MTTDLQRSSLAFLFSGGAVTGLGFLAAQNTPPGQSNAPLAVGVGLMGIGTVLWSIDELKVPILPEPKNTIKSNGDMAMGIGLMAMAVAEMSRFSRQWALAGTVIFVSGASASIYAST
jgi:hypothetical protein